MMHTCAARASSSTKVIRNRKGKRLRVDIHCHYLNADVAAKVAPLDPARHDPLFSFSNAATREVNSRQGKERGPKLTSIETRLADMDRMGIDVQAISPAPNQIVYWTDARLGGEMPRVLNDRREPSHLRRRAGAPSEAQGGAAARRRLPRALLGAHGPRARRTARLQHGHPQAALELPEEVLFRHHRLRSAHASPDGRRLRSAACAPGHRLSLRHGGSRSAPTDRENPSPRTRRARVDRRGQRRAPARNREVSKNKTRSLVVSLAPGLPFTGSAHAPIQPA